VGLAAVLALGGCAALPQSGPVEEGLKGAGLEVPFVQGAAAPPALDASGDQIVQGFLLAMLAGNTDDFEVARSYLTDEAAAAWNPLASVTIYQSGEAPSVTESAAGPERMVATYNQVGLVDEAGRYTPQEPSPGSATLELAQDDESQWRIAGLPDGIVIPRDVFQGDYVATKVYFPSADGQFLVPDQRLFARARAATDAVRQFLAGPPPYLARAVGAVVPPGTRLMTDTVMISGGVATVNLSNAISRASETARATVLASLKASLTALPTVDSIELQVESLPLAVNASTALEINPWAVDGPAYLGDGGVWRWREGGAQLIDGTAPAANWASLTVDRSLGRMAGLEDGTVAVINEVGEPAVTWALPDGLGVPSAAPVFDRLGWLWVAAGSAVVAFSAEGEALSIGQSWLEGRRVVALAPSRDGARVALVVESPASDEVELLVSGIVRGDRAVPAELTEPLPVRRLAGPVDSLSWADDVSLAFLAAPAGSTEVTAVVMTVGGEAVFFKPPTDAPSSLAAGLGTTQLYVSGRSGGLFSYSAQGRVWSPLAAGASAVVLAP
jgi:hypothetical protein